MDFKETILKLSEKVGKNKDACATEEATKTSLILPFIKALGFNIEDPHEVVPEYICNKMGNKSERVDYAILKESNPIILIECKHCKEDLSLEHVGHMKRYYQMASSKFGILTNGVNYKFFTDLDETNKMDEKPFLDINMLDLQVNQIEMLNKFQKSNFNVEEILESAKKLKYTNKLKKIIAKEFETPSPDFVRHFTKQIYDGVITASVLEYFSELTKKSLKEYLTEKITERLTEVIKREEEGDDEEEDKIINPNLRKVSVTFIDGTVINCNRVVDTFVDSIKKIGRFEEIIGLGINSSGIPLISKSQNNEKQQRQIGEFWISTNSSTIQKASILNRINRELELGLKIEIYSQQS